MKATLGSMFLPSFTISASATAAARGGKSHPIRAYVILDNTQSITNSCSGTVAGVSQPERIDCAKAGMRALLQALWPCDSSVTSCDKTTAVSAAADGTPQLGANVAYPTDEVGLLVFPAIKVLSPASSTPVGDEVDCKSNDSFSDTYPQWTPTRTTPGRPTAGFPVATTTSATKPWRSQVTIGPRSQHHPNSTTSKLVEAVDWGQCSGSTYPGDDYYGLKVIGGQGSYLAGAITEAQHSSTRTPSPG